MSIDVSCVGTLPRSAEQRALSRLSELLGTAAKPLRLVDCQYKSSVAPEKRGLESIRLLTHGKNDDKAKAAAAAQRSLKTESIDRMTISRVSAPRHFSSLQARRVANAPVGEGADYFLAAQGFSLAFESLRRGTIFKKGNKSVAVFDLCKRISDESVDDDATWDSVDPNLLLVEAVVSGETLAALASEADELAESLRAVLPDFSLESANSGMSDNKRQRT